MYRLIPWVFKVRTSAQNCVNLFLGIIDYYEL